MRPEKVPIEVDFAPAGVSPYAAVVTLSGEHDLATRDDLEAALAPLYGAVLIDLSACEFVDSTVIGLIVRKSQELGRDGHRLELVVLPGSHVERALEIVDIQQFLTMHSSVPADGDSLERPAGEGRGEHRALTRRAVAGIATICDSRRRCAIPARYGSSARCSRTAICAASSLHTPASTRSSTPSGSRCWCTPTPHSRS